jgi:hypothetical protein
MAKRGSVLLGAVMFLSGVGCASVVGIQDLPPATDSCTVDADCSQSECSASCVDWLDGKGKVCACNCSWGTDCVSGCCWSVNSGAFYACRAASACSPLYGSCTAEYQCENNNCSGFKTYCLERVCECGCTFNTDCASGCCTTSTIGNTICSEQITNCMAR